MRVNRAVAFWFSVTDIPLRQVTYSVWVWPPTIASTFVSASATPNTGDWPGSGAKIVPPAMPMWPAATMAWTPFASRSAASSLMAVAGSVTWNGSTLPGNTSSVRSGSSNPITASCSPPKSNVWDGDHSAGVFPPASTTLAER